jgi:MFS family permease
VFYGWLVALTAALGLFLNTATVIVFTFGIFAKAIGHEFHAGRSSISLAFTCHNLTGALCVPIAGRLVDRYGLRRVLIPFTIVLGPILVLGSMLSNAIWELYVFYLALGIVSGGAGAMSYTAVVSRWFDRRRGLAVSLMMLGMGLGAIILPAVAQRLVALFGWRHAYSIFGLAILLVPLPVVAAFLKEEPESMGLLPDGAAEPHMVTPIRADEEGLTVREALRTPEFWSLACALGLVTASVHACFIHLPAILTDRGSTAQTAAFVSSDIIAYLTTRYFGLRSFGELFGWLWAVFGVSGGIGAYLTGVGFDKTGSYSLPLAGFSVAAFAAMLLMISLGPYRYRMKTPHSADIAPPIAAVAPTRGGQ